MTSVHEFAFLQAAKVRSSLLKALLRGLLFSKNEK